MMAVSRPGAALPLTPLSRARSLLQRRRKQIFKVPTAGCGASNHDRGIRSCAGAVAHPVCASVSVQVTARHSSSTSLLAAPRGLTAPLPARRDLPRFITPCNPCTHQA